MADRPTLEERISRLEDIEEIKRVKWRYVHYTDRGWEGSGDDSDAWSEVFAEDGVWEPGPGGGRWEGRASISARSKAAHTDEHAKFAIHMLMNPHIEIDGDTATGDWHALVSLVGADGESIWVAGRYHDEFVRVGDSWRIKHLRMNTAYITPFEGPGWAAVRSHPRGHHAIDAQGRR